MKFLTFFNLKKYSMSGEFDTADYESVVGL